MAGRLRAASRSPGSRATGRCSPTPSPSRRERRAVERRFVPQVEGRLDRHAQPPVAGARDRRRARRRLDAGGRSPSHARPRCGRMPSARQRDQLPGRPSGVLEQRDARTSTAPAGRAAPYVAGAGAARQRRPAVRHRGAGRRAERLRDERASGRTARLPRARGPVAAQIEVSGRRGAVQRRPPRLSRLRADERIEAARANQPRLALRAHHRSSHGGSSSGAVAATIGGSGSSPRRALDGTSARRRTRRRTHRAALVPGLRDDARRGSRRFSSRRSTIA